MSPFIGQSNRLLAVCENMLTFLGIELEVKWKNVLSRIVEFRQITCQMRKRLNLAKKRMQAPKFFDTQTLTCIESKVERDSCTFRIPNRDI